MVGAMNDPSKPAPDKTAPKLDASDEERLRFLQQYLDGLKEFLKKLRQRLH